MSRFNFYGYLTPIFLLIGGCASIGHFPGKGEWRDTPGERAAAYAAKQVGTPYRYGGATPASGFDCSGLVQFSYRQAGISLPRSTEQQRVASRPVAQGEVLAGDLIFFDLQGVKNSHVGVYAGDGSFVHAPSTGREVRRDRLDSPYWKKRISETRRIIPPSGPSPG